MDFLKKDLEEIIYKNLKTTTGISNLFNLNYINPLFAISMGRNLKVFKQLKIGNYGILDLMYVTRVDNNLHFTVIELKKEKIGISAFLQALNYVKGIEDYMTFRKTGFNTSFSIHLIGKSIDSHSSFIYLPELIQGGHLNLTNYTYRYELDGLKFEQHYNYALSNKGF